MNCAIGILIWIALYLYIALDCYWVTRSSLTLCDLWTAESRLPYSSPSPGAFSNSCPLSRWCHPTILSSVIPFSSCLQSFPASGSFLMTQLFSSGVQSIGASASASVFTVNIQDWLFFKMNWFDLFEVQGTLKSLLQHLSSKASILWHLAFFMVQLSHPYMTTGKTIVWTRWAFTSKVMCLLFNLLSRFAVTFLPRSKHHLI